MDIQKQLRIQYRKFNAPEDYVGEKVKLANWLDAEVVGYDYEDCMYTIRTDTGLKKAKGRSLLHRWTEVVEKKFTSNLPTKRGS